MPKSINNYDYRGKKGNFTRDYFVTLAEMVAFPTTGIDEGHICYCEETGKHYEYRSTNTEADGTGKWALYNDATPLLQGSKNDGRIATYNDMLATNKIAMRTLQNVESYGTGLLDRTIKLEQETVHLINRTIRDRGIYSEVLYLPTEAEKGDYAFVGTDITAMQLYLYQNDSWINTGSYVDLSSIRNIDTILPNIPTDTNAPSTKLVLSLIEMYCRQNVMLTEAEYNSLEFKDPNKFYFIYEDDTEE